MSISGYNTSGLVFKSSVCFNNVEYNSQTINLPVCNVEPFELYSASSVYSDNWNQYTKAYAGIVGLGYNSTIWTIIDNPNVRKFAV